MQNTFIETIFKPGCVSRLKITPDNIFPNLYLYEVNLCI